MDIDLVRTALALINVGRHAEASRLLYSHQFEPNQPRFQLFPDEVVLIALLCWTKIHRHNGRYDMARDSAMFGVEVAQRSGSATSLGVFLESLAFIEMEAGELRLAGEFYLASADLERNRGDSEGASAALNNYGNMLIENGFEGAETLLTEAMAIAQTPLRRSLIAESMAHELARQGREGAAAVWCQHAHDELTRVEEPDDEFERDELAFHRFAILSSRNLLLVNSGQDEEAELAVEQAVEIIFELRRRQFDRSHYELYPERVKAIESYALKLIPEHGAEAVLGHVYAGEHAFDDGLRHLEDGRMGDAIDAFSTSRKHWQFVLGWHMIARVDAHLVSIFLGLGDQRALKLAYETRDLARSLGDSSSESHALGALITLSQHTSVGSDSLDLLAQCQVLKEFSDSQEPGRRPKEMPGIHESKLFSVYARRKAIRLAADCMEQSIDLARDAGSDFPGHRLAQRLANLYSFLRQHADQDRAATVLSELSRVVAVLADPDPRLQMYLERARAQEAYFGGDRSERTLLSLVDVCRAHDEVRDRAIGPGADLGGFSEAVPPPYMEAVDVAIALGWNNAALAILERSKARSLLENLGVLVPGLPESDSFPSGISLGEDLGVALFVRPSQLGAFIIDGATRTVEWQSICTDGRAIEGLGKLIQKLTSTADSEGQPELLTSTLNEIIDNELFETLCLELLSQSKDRKCWLAPSGFLRSTPLQLAPQISRAPARWSLVPALCAVSVIAGNHRLNAQGSRTKKVRVICGDPTDDLPFARLEALSIAGPGCKVAVGHQSTFAWLSENASREEIGILHLACHGRFDSRRPERSGLILADETPEGMPGLPAARFVGVEELAGLRLNGTVVVLSACSSGLEAIERDDQGAGLISAFLRAGAAAVIAAQWPIDDLSAMLLMNEVYRELSTPNGAIPISTALALAAEYLRTLTAYQLCYWGLNAAERMLRQKGTIDDANRLVVACLLRAYSAMSDWDAVGIINDLLKTTERNSLIGVLRAHLPTLCVRSNVTVFAEPMYWGAFVVVGNAL